MLGLPRSSKTFKKSFPRSVLLFDVGQVYIDNRSQKSGGFVVLDSHRDELAGLSSGVVAEHSLPFCGTERRFLVGQGDDRNDAVGVLERSMHLLDEV